MKRANLLCAWVSAGLFVSLKRRWVVAALSCACLSLLVLMFRWGLMCSSLQPQWHVRNVCKSYARGHSVGNLCPALCHRNGASVSSLACHNFYMGKEAVFSGIWDNSSVVFKSPRKTPTEELEFVRWLDDPIKKVPTEVDFVNMIKTNVKLKFNVTVNNVDARKMSYFQIDKDAYHRHIEMANVWSLLQDNEYLALQLYEKYDIFPKLMGTCGPMFAVQQMKSISRYWHLITLYDSTEQWRNRVKIAVKILDLLNVLQKGPAESLFICDVKMSHFGITDDLKKVKYIDLDSVHPVSIVNKITGDGSACKDHKDCDFFDCRSFCNLVTKKCQYGVANNNIQIVCEKIFLGWVVPGRVIVPGLLLGPHTPHELVEVLESCANPTGESGTVRAPTSTETLKRLIDFLTVLSLP